MNQLDYIEQLGQLIAKCQKSKSFKAEFMNNPRLYLLEVGMQIPAQTEICVIENNNEIIYFIIPESNMVNAEMSTENLRDILAAAGAKSTMSSAGTLTSVSTVSTLDGVSSISTLICASSAGSA